MSVRIVDCVGIYQALWDVLLMLTLFVQRQLILVDMVFVVTEAHASRTMAHSLVTVLTITSARLVNVSIYRINATNC